MRVFPDMQMGEELALLLLLYGPVGVQGDKYLITHPLYIQVHGCWGDKVKLASQICDHGCKINYSPLASNNPAKPLIRNTP